MLIGGKYKFVSKKGEGTFSEVIKAQTANNKFVAIKRMKNHFDSIEQVNNLREVQALKKLSPHPGIIKLLEVVFERSTGRLSLVFELMEMNIYELIRGRRHYLAEKKIKLYMYQLLKAMDHMHRNGIFHRDIKPENILLNEDKLKVADFGSCRGVKSKQPFTEYISTRWYRAPECLLTDGYYNYKMDMWGVGCVFFEVLSLFPLFPGTNELDQIQKIHNIVGTPPPDLLAKLKRSVHMNFNFPPKEGTGIDRLIPNAPPDCVELIKKLLAYNPDERLSARQALRHPYFRELREGEKRIKHGHPMYPSIKPSTDTQPDEAAKKQTENDKPKPTAQLPSVKPPPNVHLQQYPHSITNITNITNNTNINITTNITTNILNNPIIHPPPHPFPSSVAQPAPAPGFAAQGAQATSGANANGVSKSVTDLPMLRAANKPLVANSNVMPHAGNAGPHAGNAGHVGPGGTLKKLPVLRTNKQDIEFLSEKRKDSPPHNPTVPHPPLSPHGQPNGTTMNNANPSLLISSLPSIKGTGWKK